MSDFVGIITPFDNHVQNKVRVFGICPHDLKHGRFGEEGKKYR